MSSEITYPFPNFKGVRAPVEEMKFYGIWLFEMGK